MKQWLKILIILTLVIPFAAPYHPAQAETKTDNQNTEQKIDKHDFPKRSKERKELKAQRTENSNVYLNPDGTFTKEIFDDAIRFKDKDGTWKTIKNELKESKKENYLFENEQNKFKAYFNDQAKMQIKDGEKEITFSLAGAEKIKPAANKNLLGYKNIFKHTDLNYQVFSTTVKEELILKNNQAPTTFTYELETKGLTPKINENHSISFLEEKKEVYRMNPFFAYDANEQIATAIVPSFKEQDGKYTLTIQLDEKWLNDKERKFPVVIDPTITNSVDYGQDVFVYSADPANNYGAFEYIRAGYNGYGKARSYLNFDLRPLPSGAVIDSANLSLYQTLSTSATTAIDIHQVTSYWDFTGISWNVQPTYSTTPLASTTYPTAGSKSVAVTDLVKKWYSGETINYGFMIKAKDELQTKREFGSSRNAIPDRRPKLTVTYHIDGLGSEDFWSYDNGVNLNNGNLAVSTVDASLSGKGHPITVARTYNSRSAKKGLLGNGWQLNTEMRMVFKGDPTDGGVMTFVDADGTEHIFTYMGAEGEWNKPPGFEGTLYYANYFTDILLYDKANNEYSFNKTTGRLSKTKDKNGNTTSYSYNTDGTVKSITDASGRSVQFAYENGKLKTITGNEITKVQYTYTADNLTKVEAVSSTGTILTAVTYGYDANNNLTSVTDIKNRTSEIAYTADDRVSSFTEKVTDNGVLNTLTTKYSYNRVDYDSVITTKTDPKGTVTRFHTNDAGNIVKVEENYNATSETAEKTHQMTWDQNNLLTEIIDPRLKKTTFSYNGTNLEEVVDPALSKDLFKYDGNELIQHTSPNGETTYSHYDSNKNQSSSVDTSGNSDVVERDANGNVIKASNNISLADNIVANSGFESWAGGLPIKWSLYGNTTSSNVFISTGRPNGSYSARLVSSSDTSPTQIISDNIPVISNSSYNISWFGCQSYDGKTEVKIRWFNSSSTFISEEVVGKINEKANTWLRRNENVVAPSTAAYGRIVLGVTNTQTYFDNIQIEQGQFINQGNTVTNEGFEIDEDSNGLPDKWYTTTNISLDQANGREGSGKSVKVVGSSTGDHFLSNTVNTPGKKGTTVNFSGYSKASGATASNGLYNIAFKFYYSDGTTELFSVPFTKSTHDWEYKSKTVTASKDYTKYNIYGQVTYQPGTIWFDDFKTTVIAADNAQISNYNLVQNGSFEQLDTNGNATEWVKPSGNTGTLYVTSSQKGEPVYIGEHAYRISNSTSQNSLYTAASEPLKTGKTYTLSGMIKAEDVTSGGGRIGIQLRDSAGTWLSTKGSNKISGSGDWQRVAVTISESEAKTLNPNTTHIKAVFYTDAGTTGKVHFDALRFEEDNQISSATYDTKGNYVTSATNEDGKTIKYTNDSRGRTTRVDYIKPGSYMEAAYDELNRMTSTKDPRGLTIVPVYDEVGNVTEMKYMKTADDTILSKTRSEYNELNEVTASYDQKNYATTFERDLNRNITKTNLPNGKSILYGYNALNELSNISFTGDSTKYQFEYDKNGNLVKETKNDTEVTSYIIDADLDRVNKITNPTGSTTNITYDRVGNITSYKHSLLPAATNFEYSASGMHKKTTAPYGVETNRTYDEKGRVSTVRVKYGTVEYVYHFEYNQLGKLAKKWTETINGTEFTTDEVFVYDDHGNITQISYANGKKDLFTYDIVSRLLSEKRLNADGTTEFEKTYTYDEFGNRLTTAEGATSKTYQYDEANQLISDGTTTFTYDEVGNMLSDENFDYTYTAANQIKEVKDKNGNVVASYEYDSSGLRTKKTTPDGVEKYVYFGGDLEYITDQNDKIKYSFTRDNNGTYVAFVDHTTTTPTVYHYVLNYRGDVLALKKANGAVAVDYRYEAFGNLVSSTGTTALGNGKLLKEENPIRYASYYYDNETELYYIKARYYNSELGRFTTRDPIYNINLYAYSENNPVKLADPDGLRPIEHEQIGGNGHKPKPISQKTTLDIIGKPNPTKNPPKVYTGNPTHLKDLHYNRNTKQDKILKELNVTAEKITAKNSGWTRAPEDKDNYHENTSPYNNKYWYSYKGYELEVVINETKGKKPYIVTDPRDMGTLNYSRTSLNYGVNHLIHDMIPYYIWGNSEEDQTKFINRVVGPF